MLATGNQRKYPNCQKTKKMVQFKANHKFHSLSEHLDFFIWNQNKGCFIYFLSSHKTFRLAYFRLSTGIGLTKTLYQF